MAAASRSPCPSLVLRPTAEKNLHRGHHFSWPEEPGGAWAYNDYAINLYQKTLFDKIFQGDPATVFHEPQRFGALGF